MFYKIRLHIVILLALFSGMAAAQVPTVQDCLGAIPICQNTYSTTTSYFGMGNYPNEVNLNNCLYLGGESNSVWYVFTVQSPGMFRFVLTPNSSGDDYDWAVFNLTNYSCSNIYSNSAMMVSCNASGNTGTTGISTPMGGSGTSNGPGGSNKFNQDLPVQAGETYVLMISNWSNGTPGYTINFGTSTAQIFDNVAPTIDQINSNISCGASSLTFSFSENILCNTISTCDLSLTGPGGSYTITGLTGAACSVGGKQEKTFTINFTPPITTGGTFNLNLNAGACGSVTDLCNNVAPSGSLPFNVNLVNVNVSTTAAACATANGTATANASGGTGNYTYVWGTSPQQTTPTATNLYSGSYTVTVYDGACSAVDTAIVGSTSNMTPVTNVVNATCNQPNGSATVSVTGGTQPLTYQWSTSPVQTTTTVTGLYPGTYTVSITDATSCTITASAVISQLSPPPSASITGSDVLCYGNSTGAANLNVTGGAAPLTYLWSNGATTQNLSGVSAGPYTVTVTDAVSCSTTANVTINQSPQLVLSTTGDDSVCLNQQVTFTASATGGVAPYVYTWDNGLGAGDTQTVTATATTTYNVSVTDGNNCTAGPVALTVYVYGPLSVNVTALPGSICEGEQTVLTANVTGGGQPYSYTWSNSSLTNSSITVAPAATTDYYVTVSDNCGSPIATSSVNVVVNPLPVAGFSANPLDGCVPLSVSFTDLSSLDVQSWTWDFNDPLSGNLNTSNQQNPTHLFSNGGTYSIGLTVTTADGCKNTFISSNLITAYPNPEAAFHASPNPASSMNPEVTFFDQSVNASSWLWSFNDPGSVSNTSNAANTSHIFSVPGSYVVWLVVETDYGCIDSTSMLITVNQDLAFWVPSAFSPNEDGLNDVFNPKGINIDSDTYQLFIYDRWGKELFVSEDINFGWDGTIRNKDTFAPVGVYTWIIKFKEINGKSHSYNGRVTLIK